MATRDVQLRLTATGLDKLVAQFDALSKKLDTIISRLDDISRKLDVLGAKKATPSVKVEGLDEALAKIAILKAALDDVGSSRSSANIGTEGGTSSTIRRVLSKAFPLNSGFVSLGGGRSDGAIFRASDRTALGAALNDAQWAEAAAGDALLERRSGGMTAADRGAFNLLGRWGRLGSLGGLFGSGGFFGPGGGLMRGAGAAGGAVGSAGTALGKVPWAGVLGGGGIGLLASMLPALVPMGIGTLVGGGATFGAFRMASTANTNLTALQSTLQSAQQTYQQDVATGASSKQTAYDRLQMVQAQQAVTAFQKQNAPALGLYGAGQNLAGAAGALFSGALTANGTRSIDTSRGIKQVSAPGSSFLSGIGSITNQAASYVKTVGVGNLASTFQAALPFIQTVVKSLEDFANIMGPVITRSMQQFRPYLPIMRQGFKELSLGIADFIKYLGPGMQAGAVIFKTAMTVLRGLLIAASVVIVATATSLEKLGTAIMAAARVVETAAKDIWRFIKTNFDDIVQGAKDVIPKLEAIGKQIVQGLIHGIESMAGAVLGAVRHLASMIPSALSSVLHIFSPSRVMFGLGAHIGEGLALGIDSKQGRVLSSAANLARGIPGAVGGGAYGGSGARPIQIQFSFAGGGDEISRAAMKLVSHGMRISGGDPRILIRKTKMA